MRKIALAVANLGTMLALALPVTPALATFLTTYVSASGSDTNNTCGDQTTPCRTFHNALANTTPGGAIICVSGGGFDNLFTISQSVTIDCGGGVGISLGRITVDGSNIVVKLRNLTFNSESFFNFGIEALNMAALFVENCQILGFNNSNGSGPAGIGIKFAPTNGVTAKLYVSDSVISNNGLPASGGGIIVQPSGSGSARVVIERTRVENNFHGILVDGTGSTGVILVQVRDSVVAGNLGHGIAAISSAGASPTGIIVDRTSSAFNAASGILAQGAAVHLGNSTVTGNATGLNVAGGQILSYQNNQTSGNFTDGAPTGVLTLR
jgi:hypothetical protein